MKMIVRNQRRKTYPLNIKPTKNNIIQSQTKNAFEEITGALSFVVNKDQLSKPEMNTFSFITRLSSCS